MTRMNIVWLCNLSSFCVSLVCVRLFTLYVMWGGGRSGGVGVGAEVKEEERGTEGRFCTKKGFC